VGTTYGEAPSGWYRPLVDWISNDPFYYYHTQTMTLDIDESCDVYSRGFFITGVLNGLPTTTTDTVTLSINVSTKNIGISGQYTATTSSFNSSTFVNYGGQIGGGEVVTAITITSIITPNPLHKTTYSAGTTTLCPVILNAEYVVFKYNFTVTSGRDLDTLTTLYINNNTTVPYDNTFNPVGYCPMGVSPPSGVYAGPNLYWGGDNTLTFGTESVYVDIKELKLSGSVTTVLLNCRANWFGARLDGMVGIQMSAYSGGTMISDGAYGFISSGGTQLGTTYNFSPVDVTSVQDGCATSTCVGLYKYDIASGVFSVDPTCVT
jgi:hypothetical protein